MTTVCRSCAQQIPEADAYPVLASGEPAYVCSPRCGQDIAEATAHYARSLDKETA